ncbi:MAG: hypothetical protein ACLFR7_01720 [Opitutales bacterium]
MPHNTERASASSTPSARADRLRRALSKALIGAFLLASLLVTAAGWTILAASPHASATIMAEHPWDDVVERIHTFRP